LAALGCAQNHEKEEKEGPEIKLTLDQVPDAVKATLTREAEGSAFTSVDKESDDGKAVYETDVTLQGKNYEIKVADDGSLISKKIDTEDEKPDNDKKD
jgi:hypothetical protein